MNESPKVIFEDKFKKVIFADENPKVIFADEFKKHIFDEPDGIFDFTFNATFN